VELAATDDIGAAVTAARNAEVAIVIAGYTAADEGEYVGSDTMTRPELLALFPPMPADFDVTTLFPSASSNSGTTDGADAIGPIMSDGMGGDRASLRLRPFDEELIAAVAAANPRTVVVLVAAGPVITEQWREQVPGLMVMWYAGMEGGHALADVLSGRHNPSGRLPFAVAASEDHLPFFDRDATSITYDRFHGQRLLDRLGVDAAFPHGFGLSYTSFSIDAVAVEPIAANSVRLNVTVTNSGDLDGRHVVQVYGSRSTGSYAGELFLCGFGVIELAAGERGELAVDVALLPLAEWDPALRDRVLPALKDVRLEVGAFAHDPSALSVDLT
jgi:beta-glucosidase